MPPTFGTDPSLIQAIIAGAEQAMVSAVENVEDCMTSAPAALSERMLNHRDVVLGIAASGRTPFVLSALDYARSVGAKTIALTTRGRGLISQQVDATIAPDVGAEVLSGSTRMKSGSAQKMLLGMISTSVMIQLGKVHGNLMIDVKASNQKLRMRAQHIVSEICAIGMSEASNLLNQVDYNVRAAILLQMLNLTPTQAIAKAMQPFQSLTQQM